MDALWGIDSRAIESAAQPLPGLLDDPQFQSLDFPTRSDLHIAPLRNPVPGRTPGIPSPLEPKASRDVESTSSKAKLSSQQKASRTAKRTPPITAATIILAKDARKPITAISELLESTTQSANEPVIAQLPSFVSLSVVEKSYLSPPSMNSELRATKRPRLELDLGISDDYIHLPRPQQQHQGQRAPPLLPAIVNGIHEPPPNAALLPPMATETQSRRENRERLQSASATSSGKAAPMRPPEKMLNSPLIETAESVSIPEPSLSIDSIQEQVTELVVTTPSEKQQKTRKTPRKWTVDETQHLLRGVEKHGFGRWKLILEDPAFSFDSRTAVDLKDRYRVCVRERQRKSSIAIEVGEPLATSSPSTINTVAQDSGGLVSQSSPVKPSDHIPSKGTGRRVRRAWTPEEDENLLKGMAKYGFQ